MHLLVQIAHPSTKSVEVLNKIEFAYEKRKFDYAERSKSTERAAGIVVVVHGVQLGCDE